MTKLILFSIFSTRRQEETCRILAEDMNEEHSQVIVRDMKNPGEKIGNDVPTTLTPEALQLIKARGVTKGRIWPFNAESVSSSFTRACKFLGIEDLHFHDLRHEGVSRLFEMGWTIPQAAMVSGHRSWKGLQRYTHIKHTGDKYAGWQWKSKIISAQA
jgi:integrase